MTDFLSIEFGIALLALSAVIVFRWGFKHLPGEGWQFAVAIPARVDGAEGKYWPAVNITFYGVISSAAYALSLLLYVFLMGATGQPFAPAALFVAILLLVGIPASKIVARWVEGAAGHTIGGAVFAVLVAAMPAMAITQAVAKFLGWHAFSPAALTAAAAIAYVLGEAIGRLACLSFGCCYGRPIDTCTSLQKALYSKFTETYRGRFKKIAFAGGLHDRAVIAVQSIACALLFGLFLISLWLFWRGHFAMSLIVALGGSQLWRAYSEQLRADYRGRDGFTLYQAMALVGAALSAAFAAIYAQPSDAQIVALAARGWTAIVRVEVLVACQALAVMILFYMGRSSITSSRLELVLNAPSPKS